MGVLIPISVHVNAVLKSAKGKPRWGLSGIEARAARFAESWAAWVARGDAPSIVGRVTK